MSMSARPKVPAETPARPRPLIPPMERTVVFEMWLRAAAVGAPVLQFETPITVARAMEVIPPLLGAEDAADAVGVFDTLYNRGLPISTSDDVGTAGLLVLKWKLKPLAQ
jgi:hypothetical protein